MLAPDAKALAETGCDGAPRPGKMGAAATGVEAGVGVGCEGVGVDVTVVST